MAVKRIPEGYPSVTPDLLVQGVPSLLNFLKQAFDATEIFRMPPSDGTMLRLKPPPLCNRPALVCRLPYIRMIASRDVRVRWNLLFN